VHRDDLLTDLAEHGHRHAAAADVRARPALDGHRAAQQHRTVVVDLGTGLGDPGGHRVAERPGQAQPALDHGTTRVGADPAGVGAAAEQQPETGHHHRLAGAGLTGDDVHPRCQTQRRVIDDAQSGDPQFLQHRANSIGGI
jgi:hypothetical protein